MKDRHVGDLGNVLADPSGAGNYRLLDHQVTLYGPYSVVGRSCVLHRLTDDLGTGGNEESTKTGNAGARVACGVIGLASE
jgi:Cu-Zn family superoxide dismutase